MLFQLKQHFIKNSKASQFLLFIVFAVALGIIYYPARKMCLYDDVLNFLALIKQIGWRDFPSSYGYTSLYFGHDILIVGLYKLFGNHSFAWYMVSILWHTLNSFLLYSVVRLLLLEYVKNDALWLAIGTSLLFLLSPLQAENIIYLGSLQYAPAISIFFAWVIFIHQKSNGKVFSGWHIIIMHALFIISLYTHEITIVFPLLFTVIYFLIIPNNNYRKYFLLKLLMPTVFYVLVYFVIHRAYFGNWFPHYGTAHFQNYKYAFLQETFSINMFKNIFFINYLSEFSKNFLYALSKNNLITSIFWTLLFVLSMLFAWKKNKFFAKLMLAFYLLFLLFYAPIANFWSWPNDLIFNDRLFYFARIWLYMIISFSFYCIHKKIFLGTMAIFIFINIFNIFPTVKQFSYASRLYEKQIFSLPKKGNAKIFLLNTPNKYNGVFLNRYGYSESNAFSFFRNDSIEKHVEIISRIAETDMNCSIDANYINDSTIVVKNRNAFESFNFDAIGNNPSFKNTYSCKNLEAENGYELIIPQNTQPYLVYYFTNSGWRELYKR